MILLGLMLGGFLVFSIAEIGRRELLKQELLVVALVVCPPHQWVYMDTEKLVCNRCHKRPSDIN